MTDAVWHVPFAGRNESTVYRQNFLAQYGNVYVMDNHRAAFWCWLREINAMQPFNLVHIDRHYDCLPITGEWQAATPDVAEMSIDEYLGYEVPMDGDGGSMRLFRWDSYLSLFLHKTASQMRQFWCATHHDGAEPPVEPTDTVETWQLPGALNCLKSTDDAPWICNVDLDFFFYSVDQKVVGRMVSDHYIEQLFNALRRANEANEVGVITVCLSPECCGGWASAEAIAAQACDVLGVPFTLPAAP